MLELEEAQRRILSAVRPSSSELIPLQLALGRIVADSATAAIDLPTFDNSAMDGYAVRAEDLAHSSPERPVPLRLIGRVAAGEASRDSVEPGACVRLFTGSPLPCGADAVVMQEDVRLVASDPSVIVFPESIKPWENVRFRGEDLKRGASITTAGEHLSAGQIALLASMGCREINVGARPVVGLVATGSELREPGEALGPAQIYESNRTSLAALISRVGGTAVVFPLVGDELSATRSVLERALNECDVVVTSGGVSVGEFDLVKNAFEALGAELMFWRIAVKPGKPFVFGRWREKLLFGLPGNPVSALVTFLLLVRPALLRFQGAANVSLLTHPAVMAEALVNRGDRRHFMRVTVDGEGKIRSAGAQASHIFSSLAKANGLIDVPAETTLQAGQTVSVLRWET
ncbi:MAG: molybdopterin molybdotransferase MoeA [Verrucomicrobia bacterium]|nr:molybdopterin molybdotransferase MoeA [Verrucomicrobiota bacterium]